MLTVKVLNQLGAEVEALNVNADVFGIEPNQQAIFDAVQVALSNRRQATAKTLKRDEVSGGGKKPWRQKGTGRARQGSTRAPQWRHGGIVFGPTGEQNYKIKMNKKVRVLALKSALSEKMAANEIVVVDKFELDAPKTKEMIKILDAIKAEGKKMIVYCDEEFGENAFLSAVNIPSIEEIIPCSLINVYDVLNCKTLIMTKAALECVEEGLLNG